MDNSSILLSGVSSFWTEFFEDKEIIKALLEGAVQDSSFSYKRILGSLVNTSMENCPIRLNKPMEPIEVSINNLIEINSKWYSKQRHDLASLDIIYSNVNSPETILERGVDFDFLVPEDSNIPTDTYIDKTHSYIAFYANPFNWLGKNMSISGARTSEKFIHDNYFIKILDDMSGFTVSSGDIVTITVEGVAYTSEVLLFISSADDPLEIGVYLVAERPVLQAGKGILTLANNDEYSVEVSGENYPVSVLHLWAVNAKVDPLVLYNNYGFHFTEKVQYSSEEYKSLLLALHRLKVDGPSIDCLLSVLSLMVGLPVFKDEDEQVLNYFMDGNGTNVVTNLRTFIIPQPYSLRSEVQDSSVEQFGSINTGRVITSFKRYEHMTDAFTVKDDQSNPNWWGGRTIPEEVAPNWDANRRVIVSFSAANTISTNKDSRIGDYNFLIGDATRYAVSYSAANDFYSNHFIGITGAGVLSLTAEQKTILKNSVPAHCVLHIY